MAETTVTLESTLSALIEGKKYATLRDILVTMNPADVAAVFEETDELALPLLFRLLPKELAAETFVEMQPEQQELLIRGFSDTELKEVVDELYVDDAVDLVGHFGLLALEVHHDMRAGRRRLLRRGLSRSGLFGRGLGHGRFFTCLGRSGLCAAGRERQHHQCRQKKG